MKTTQTSVTDLRTCRSLADKLLEASVFLANVLVPVLVLSVSSVKSELFADLFESDSVKIVETWMRFEA